MINPKRSEMVSGFPGGSLKNWALVALLLKDEFKIKQNTCPHNTGTYISYDTDPSGTKPVMTLRCKKCYKPVEAKKSK